jgi:hypothetical protein
MRLPWNVIAIVLMVPSEKRNGIIMKHAGEVLGLPSEDLKALLSERTTDL